MLNDLVRKFELLADILKELARRLVAEAEAKAMGFGGVTAVGDGRWLVAGNTDPGCAD